MSNFYIERVRVEGGFLDGLDISLKNGLNTIIGARGTGKSTIVELIRYCLGIKGHTAESDLRSLSHARSVLGDGQVTVYVSNGIETYTYFRNFESTTALPLSSEIKPPLIFSQTEIENIGLTSRGRLKLIDDFLIGLDDIEQKEISQIAIIQSYSSEIISLSSGISDLEDKLLTLPVIKQELITIEVEEKKFAQSSKLAELKNNEINKLSEVYIKLQKDISHYNEFNFRLKEILNTLDSYFQKESDFVNFIDDDEAKDEFLLVHELIVKAKEKINIINSKKEGEHSLRLAKINDVNKKGQELRSEFDQLQKGAGEISRKRQHYLQLASQLEEMKKVNLEKEKRILDLKEKRDNSICLLHSLRKQRTALRLSKCNELCSNLSPKIKITLEIESQLDEYKQVLINSLKGSSIKYNEIAPVICESIPPMVLLNIIENNDIETFIESVSISKERAFRIINSLKNSIDKISTVLLDDEIKLELLDGSEYKELSELSTGQRCTVILPIILEHANNTLVIDQPEDHIDNAFIVDTLISSITRRAGKGQILITTHNANLPVLGDAIEVIHLNSDGTRGYVVANGDLQDPSIIDAISNVMEGGRDAFNRRAKFYG
ncbi:AAA family ATPase [Morganella morganii]|uniref:AAA family ATPase n=1 Tax=Morganella morganii TaxID=582 RepID=UPI00052CB1A4|nr:AAA family ATPase [Morganella morganii]KGP46173.1 hypothetical protein LR61_01265 [Morganella morganii]